jgi:hypothetical protein
MKFFVIQSIKGDHYFKKANYGGYLVGSIESATKYEKKHHAQASIQKNPYFNYPFNIRKKFIVKQINFDIMV